MTTGLSTEGVELIEREILGVGLLRFESNPPGTWFTKKGDVAKRARRRYLLNDAELDSVSSIVDTLSKPALLRWYEEQGLIGGGQAALDGLLAGKPVEDWADICRMYGYGPSARAGDGAERGKAIHAAFDAMARTGDPPSFSDYPVAWHKWLQGAVRAWLALDPQIIESEQIVCNPAYGYAGRFDLYALSHGVRAAIDYKTSARGRVFDAAHYQTRGYGECFPICGLEPPERIVIVALDDDANFDPVECAVTADEWYDVLRVFRSRKRANAAMAAERKARKATAA